MQTQMRKRSRRSRSLEPRTRSTSQTSRPEEPRPSDSPPQYQDKKRLARRIKRETKTVVGSTETTSKPSPIIRGSQPSPKLIEFKNIFIENEDICRCDLFEKMINYLQKIESKKVEVVLMGSMALSFAQLHELTSLTVDNHNIDLTGKFVTDENILDRINERRKAFNYVFTNLQLPINKDKLYLIFCPILFNISQAPQGHAVVIIVQVYNARISIELFNSSNYPSMNNKENRVFYGYIIELFQDIFMPPNFYTQTISLLNLIGPIECPAYLSVQGNYPTCLPWSM